MNLNTCNYLVSPRGEPNNSIGLGLTLERGGQDIIYCLLNARERQQVITGYSLINNYRTCHLRQLIHCVSQMSEVNALGSCQFCLVSRSVRVCSSQLDLSAFLARFTRFRRLDNFYLLDWFDLGSTKISSTRLGQKQSLWVRHPNRKIHYIITYNRARAVEAI